MENLGDKLQRHLDNEQSKPAELEQGLRQYQCYFPVDNIHICYSLQVRELRKATLFKTSSIAKTLELFVQIDKPLEWVTPTDLHEVLGKFETYCYKHNLELIVFQHPSNAHLLDVLQHRHYKVDKKHPTVLHPILFCQDSSSIAAIDDIDQFLTKHCGGISTQQITLCKDYSVFVR